MAEGRHTALIACVGRTPERTGTRASANACLRVAPLRKKLQKVMCRISACRLLVLVALSAMELETLPAIDWLREDLA